MRIHKFDIIKIYTVPAGDGAKKGFREVMREPSGHIEICQDADEKPTEKQLLEALFRHKLRVSSGLTAPAVPTTDRRRVYAKDTSGDGSKWEVGYVAGRVPILQLTLVEKWDRPAYPDPRLISSLLHDIQLCDECETRDCAYNDDGECRYAMVHHCRPEITEEDGCKSGVILFL